MRLAAPRLLGSRVFGFMVDIVVLAPSSGEIWSWRWERMKRFLVGIVSKKRLGRALRGIGRSFQDLSDLTLIVGNG